MGGRYLANFGSSRVRVATVVEPGDSDYIAFATRDLKRQEGISGDRLAPESLHDNLPVSTDHDLSNIVRWNLLAGFLDFALPGFHWVVNDTLYDYLVIDRMSANFYRPGHDYAPQLLRPTRIGRVLVYKTPSALTITSKSLVSSILMRVETKLCDS